MLQMNICIDLSMKMIWGGGETSKNVFDFSFIGPLHTNVFLWLLFLVGMQGLILLKNFPKLEKCFL